MAIFIYLYNKILGKPGYLYGTLGAGRENVNYMARIFLEAELIQT